MADKIRTAVIGCGGLGRSHARTAKTNEEVDLVAVCDPILENAKAVAAENDVKGVYSDYKELLANEKLDCIIVVSPTYTHAEITVDSANAGIHVFCEKPMAITLEECDCMIEATEKSKVFLMLGFVRRFQPNYRELKRRAEAGDIGEIKLVQSVRMGGRPPAGIGDWRRERSKVGGLHSAYIHEMDQMLWVGGDVKTVSGVVNYGAFEDNDVEDNIWMCIEFKNGAVGAMGSSQIYPVGWYEYGVGGTEGCMRVEGESLIFMRHGGNVERLEFPPNNMMVEEINYFFDCVRKGEPPSVTGVDGRKSLEVVLAAFKSSETKQVITLPL